MLDESISQELDTRDGRQGPRFLSVVFYVLAVVLSAAVATTIRVEWLGFWFMTGALCPLAFLLCLLGPNGPLRMGLAMIGGMVVGWFIISPPAAFVMLFFAFTLVFLNALLIFIGGLLGTLLRQGIVAGYKRLTNKRSFDATQACASEEIRRE